MDDSADLIIPRDYLCFCRLAYLHEDVEPQILHGRLRSSCILLDQQWNPKIASFGLVELLPSEYSAGALAGETLVVSPFFPFLSNTVRRSAKVGYCKIPHWLGRKTKHPL